MNLARQYAERPFDREIILNEMDYMDVYDDKYVVVMMLGGCACAHTCTHVCAGYLFVLCNISLCVSGKYVVVIMCVCHIGTYNFVNAMA